MICTQKRPELLLQMLYIYYEGGVPVKVLYILGIKPGLKHAARDTRKNLHAVLLPFCKYAFFEIYFHQE
jgi:hypothetical protein